MDKFTNKDIIRHSTFSTYTEGKYCRLTMNFLKDAKQAPDDI